MPPTGGAEWAVARFPIEGMFSNDTHSRVLQLNQRYDRFRFILNGGVKAGARLELDWVVVWRGKDDQKPTTPKDMAVKVADGKATCTWSPSTDNVGVFYYRLLYKEKGGEDWKLLTVCTSNYFQTDAAGLPAGEFAVEAVDVADNVSERSQTGKP